MEPKRPTQAVILAGGQGSRLRPLTDLRPKPMIEILGKPFLEYQINQLREQGFKRVLLLLGYLAHLVQDYFKDGAGWGIQIEYLVTAEEDNTGRRLKLSEPLLDERFLLMYCDNYWPMQFDRMWRRYLEAALPVMLTVYTNRDGYTRNSVRVDEQGYLAVFDKHCTLPELQGVEISYGIFHRSAVSLLPDENISLEDYLYPKLATGRQLAAFVSDHRYYSVGALHRLPLTEAFLSGRPTIFLDRDGVLNRKPPRACYVRSWSEFEWLPGAKAALRLLQEAGYRVILISNQAGVGRGAMSEADLKMIHLRMQQEVTEAGGKIEAVYYCPHDWDAGCECRKPKPGLLFAAQRTFSLDLTRTWFVGDDERDGQAADAAGCPSVLVSEKTPLISVVRRLINGFPGVSSI